MGKISTNDLKAYNLAPHTGQRSLAETNFLLNTKKNSVKNPKTVLYRILRLSDEFF